MIMAPALRKLMLTAHVTSSVGWLGAVAGFFALAVAGLGSQKPDVVRSAYLMMELSAWAVIVPLSLASPLTGVIQSLGTHWGLVRHSWVLVKLLITVPATVLLLLHMRAIDDAASAAAATTFSSTDLYGLRLQLAVNAGAAMLVLLAATALSVFKPRGLTPWGQRAAHAEEAPGAMAERSGETTLAAATAASLKLPRARWVNVFGIVGIILFVHGVILHLAGGGLGGH